VLLLPDLFPYVCLQAVRAAVNMLVPAATVYEVRHCARAVLERMEEQDEQLRTVDAAAAGRDLASSGWQLACTSGETGISWFV
jgi:hypothetical protein